MLTSSTVRTKYPCLITRFQTLWPRRVTMLWHLCQSTLSKPHQIQWVRIHVSCSSNSLPLGTDMLKYELCVYPPALFEAAGSMLQSDKPSQANAIQGWIHPSSIQIPQYVSNIYVGGALIPNNNSIENWADLWVTVWKVCWVCKKKTGPTTVLSVWWLLRWSFYKRQFSSQTEEIIWQELFLSERNNLGTLLKKDFFSVRVKQLGYIFCWVMEWWHLLGLIRSLLKSI